MRNACLWVFPLNRLFFFYSLWISAVYCTFSRNCQNLCTSNLEGELGITNLCYVSDITGACIQGCQFWNETVQINCPLKCNETYTKACETVSCKFGCSRAEDAYGAEAQNYLNKPRAPFASAIGSHSVTLGWKPANISGVKYIIQWKYNQLPGDWRYTEVISETSYTVKDLQAYTEYMFRVVWIITSQLQLHSPSSPSYRTHAFGAPATAPVIKDIQSSSPNTVEVSWSPPLFPNGLIIGYNLLLTSANHELLRASRGHSFQFYSTFPNTTYRFSIVAVNEIGAGPPAEANITTAAPKVKEKASWFFLSRKESLRKRYTEYFLAAAQCLPDEIIHHHITGISVNIYQQVVYFSEGNSIWVKGVANMSDVSDLTLFYAGWGNITSISVDWLYHRIYFVMNEKIHVCHLENCTVVEDITPLYVTSPRKVIADPYNGYIFCLLEDGIYRANLPLFPGTASTASPVVRSSALRAFMINFQSKRLIFFNKTEHAFVSGFLDGSEFRMLRSHVPFNDVESFVYEDNTFTVTDGSAVFHEEVSPGSSSFNEYTVDCNLVYPEYFGFGNLIFYGASAQPFPLPTAPRLVMVLFGLDQAVISWRPPEHSIGTSLSAWQKWTYDVKVSSQHPFEEKWIVSNVSNTRLTVKGLASFKVYEVSVRAVSPAGAGPWSESFRGTTLEEAEEDPCMLAVGPEGLWKQRLDSYGPGELLYPHIGNISDLDWYNNTLYWINSMGEVQTWSFNTRKGTTENTYIPDVRDARMLALDWLGQCLYWAGKANTIYRKSLRGGHMDVVARVMLPVKDLVVDSVNGYLYWATMYSVESTRLNGEEYLMLQEQLQFSDKQVVGLTLDLTQGFLYWLVQDSLCLNLYRASLCKEHCGNAIVTEFAAWSTSEISQGALEYYSGRLFWINRLQFITTQEVNQSLSVPFSQPAQFTAFTLVHASLKPLPGNLSFTPKVIPDAVPESSFKIKGNSSSFHITWSPSTEVEWGAVFYCVGSKALQSLKSEQCLHPHNLTVPSYQVDWLEPFALFDFTVTPYTYWGKAPMTSVSLRAPEGVPSAPRNPRIYVLRHNLHENDEKVLVEFRWDRPERDNGVLTQFRIYYQLLNQSGTADTFTEWNASNVKTTLMHFSLKNVLPSLTVRFQVQAFTSVGPGPLSEMAERNTSDLFPVPTLITITANNLFLADIDSNHTMWELSTKTNVKDVCFTANDDKAYYIIQDSLFILNMQNASKFQFFKDAYLQNVTAITVDWIARHLFLASKTPWNETQIFVINLELKKKSLKALNVQLGKSNSTASSLLSYPFLSRLYWMEELDHGSHMFYYDILNNTVHHILGYISVEEQMRNYCTCNLTEAELGRPMSIDVSDSKNPQLLFIRGRDEIWASDVDGCHCWRITKIPGFQGKKISSLTADKKFIYWSAETKEYTEIWLANKESTRYFLHKRQNHKLKILAYSSAAQLYPDKRCLMVLPDTEKPTILATTNTSFTLRLPSVTPQQLCPGITQSTPTYLVFFREMTDNCRNPRYCLSALQQKMLEFQDPIAVLDNLQPFSSYAIQVAVKNYYSEEEVQPMGKHTVGTTLCGVPEAVDTIKTLVLSDTTINISWSEPLKPNGPLESIRYQIAVNLLPPVPMTPLRKSEFSNGMLAWSVSGLQPGISNSFKVLAFHPEENWFSESVPVIAKTFETPPAPVNIVPRNTSFQLEWRAPLHIKESSFWFELCKWPTKSDWFSPASTTCTADLVYTCNLTGTLPSTNYFVRVTVVYVTGLKSTSSSTSFKTTAGVPSKPGVPKRAEDSKNSIQWEKADDNGSNLTYYILESRKQSGNTSKMKFLWEVVYNGSCGSICTWKAKNLEGTFQFRVAAANALGVGEYSDTSKNIVLGKEGTGTTGTITTIASVIGVVLSLAVVLLFVFVWHQRWKSSKQALPGRIVFIKEDKELAQLRGMSETVGIANACYAIRTLPSQAEIESLPAFPRDKLNLHKLLGSGAFGEVYEGTAVDILAGGNGESKVAVKTLKKGATDHEKSEFLKEAHLMSKFDHPHILKLLGVCLLNEPQYLILELMEGGDLLNYLRGARKQKLQNPLLTMTDLLDICLDVCKGCVYLEKMHFIHRDLAARNCLVSEKEYESSSRIVKIGDFGLARDVYKNDYYRKRGEGLLPVRWMAPESLIDGVFTNHSDVWAFGILVWETLTLGQQPYPGLSNTEVLHHVRSGGRLESPNNCPDDLCDLVTRCWSQEPHNRPTFSYIHAKLQEIRHCQLSFTHYLEEKEASTGVINQAFEDNETPYADSDSVLSATLMETRNQEGLSYLVLVKEGKQDQGSINSTEHS
ncbi:PREDICTED: proto-oncogene tyrosine-protein kinase ROS isoform X1 [Lepidothrix coronata]|uniref:Tyrosine-protein kinase receptor n=1 Tax=Lepidothrix coronata TaxID=321398 RepID=A0A6J0IFG3_9PASS|nr:PREDICTED: proto-oncogene tyrosine-protein kinase ROS isoform X1 [Lepidothrix coronata]